MFAADDDNDRVIDGCHAHQKTLTNISIFQINNPTIYPSSSICPISSDKVLMMIDRGLPFTAASWDLYWKPREEPWLGRVRRLDKSVDKQLLTTQWQLLCATVASAVAELSVLRWINILFLAIIFALMFCNSCNIIYNIYTFFFEDLLQKSPSLSLAINESATQFMQKLQTKYLNKTFLNQYFETN